MSSSADRYARLLLPKKHGYPLWNPRPCADATATTHLENGVQLGDVGVVQYDGAFVWLFNIRDHNKGVVLRPQNAYEIFQPPENSTIEWEQNLLLKYKGNIEVNQVSPVGATAGASRDHEYHEGASLVVPRGAIRQGLMNTGHLLKSARSSAFAWKDYVCNELGHDLPDKSLYIITGYDKSNSWVAKTWLRQSKSHELQAGITIPGAAGGGVSMARTVDRPEDRSQDSYHSTNHTTPKNQCNFLHGYKLTYSDFSLLGLGKLKVSAGKDLQNKGSFHAWSFTKDDSRDSKSSLNDMGSRSASGLNDSGELEEVEISDISSKTYYHPLLIINEFILHQLNDVPFIITHDQAWISVIEENEPFPTDEELLQRICSKYTAIVQPGEFAMLADSACIPPTMQGSKYEQNGLCIFEPSDSLDIDKILDSLSVSFYSEYKEDSTLLQEAQEKDSKSAQHAKKMVDLTDLNRSIQVLEDAILHMAEAQPSHLNSLGRLLLTRFKQLGEVSDLNRSIQILDDAILLIPDNHPDKPSYLNNLGCSLLAHFEQLGDFSDLTKSIQVLEDAVHHIPDGHPDKASYLNSLGRSLLTHIKQQSDLSELDRSIQVLEDAVKLTSDGHPDRPSYLNNLGNLLLTCFKQLGDLSDLSRSLELLEDAVQLTPDGHPDRAYHLSNLGSSLLTCFEQQGDSSSLDRSLQVLEDAILLTPDGHPNKPSYLNNIGSTLLTCCEQLDNLTALNRSIQILEDAVLCTPEGCPDKPSHLNNHGRSLLVCFKQLGNLSDLERSLLILENAISLTPEDHPGRPSYLDNLGNSLLTHFQQLGDLSELNRSVQVLEDAALHLPDGHPDKPSHLNNLGRSLLTCFKQQGEPSKLERSIQVFKDAVSLIPDSHPKKPSLLSNLGTSLLTHFEWQGNPSELDRSIGVFKDAVALIQDAHPDKPAHLNNLGHSLLTRFEQLGDLSDLKRSIQVEEDAIFLTPDGHPNKPSFLNNLGKSLLTRFQQLGDLSDLKRSIQVFEDAVLLTPDGHSDKPSHLNNLGKSLLTRFQQLGDLSDLKRSIQVFEDAVLLTPDGHSDKPSHLNNLGNSLLTRFEQLGDLSDLKRSIQVFEDAVLLIPDGHSDKPSHLNNLGNSLLTRFQQLGNLSDLKRSIQVKEDAVLLTPDGHSDKPSYLNNLGNSLLTRFEQLGDLSDLKRSIQVFEDAVLLTPDGHSDKPSYLNSLGGSLLTRFEQLGDLSDLKRSIQVFEDAVLLTPDGHSDKPSYLNSLGGSLLTRFEQLGDLSDLKRSIQVFEDAVLLTPDGHSNKPGYLNSLGGSLLRRFEQLGDLSDLKRSIQVREDAVLLTPDGHSDKPSYLINLGDSLVISFKKFNDLSDLYAAVSSFDSAAHSITGSVLVRFIAASKWMQTAHQYLPDQSIESAAMCINFIPQLTWLGTSIHDRHHQITHAGQVARDAAAIATQANKYDTAVEWLEQGHSVIWSQMMQLHSSLDELQLVQPELAQRLQHLSFILEHQDHTSQSSAQVDYHAYTIEREELLKRIRELPGFERFLLSKTSAQLLSAAKQGPIVMLNVSEIQCDALVLVPEYGILHVSLDNLTMAEAWAWNKLFQLAKSQGSVSITDFPLQKALQLSDWPESTMSSEDVLIYILKELWFKVVHPILNALGINQPVLVSSEIHHLWWCPTGPLSFLPIHAAGVYSQPSGPKLMDFAVSSYTPSLAVLLARSSFQMGLKKQLLTISLPMESRLPGTAKEVQLVASHAQDFSVLNLQESKANKQAVLDAMKTSTWVHFACHGMQNTSKPTESCLLLAGHTRLTLSEIIQLHLNHAELAFLSASETATGDEKLADEAVHLAAGMLLAGFRGVIATMWGIQDEITIEVVDETYQLLFKEYGADSTRAAEALHFAVKKVCEKREARGSKVPLLHWAPFIHMGI